MSAQAQKSTSKSAMYWLHILIMLLFMFAFRFLTPITPITEVGMQVLGVFLGIIWGWVFIGIFAPSLVGLFALGVTDYAPMSDIFFDTFGSQNAVMILAMILLTALISEKHLDQVIVSFLLSRKVAIGKPWIVFFMFLLATFITSTLTTSIPAAFLMLQIFRSLKEEVGLEPYSKAIPAFFVGISFSSVLGEVALPIKGAVFVYLSLVTKNTGIAANYGAYTLFAIPMCLLLIVAYVLFCKYILRIDMSKLADSQRFLQNQPAITKVQKISLVFVFVFLLAILSKSVFVFGQIAVVLNNIGYGGLGILVLGIMACLKVDNQPLLQPAKIAPYFSWEAYLLCVTVIEVAGAFSSDVTGVKAFVTGGILPIAQNLSSYSLVLFIILATILVTNVMNNIIAGSIMVSVAALVGSAIPGTNVVALSVMAAFASMFAIFTPAASPICALLFGQKDLVHAKDQAMYGLLTALLLFVMLATVGWLFATLLF